jgi:hypothetical protein
MAYQYIIPLKLPLIKEMKIIYKQRFVLAKYEKTANAKKNVHIALVSAK